MEDIPVLYAKLAGLYKNVKTRLSDQRWRQLNSASYLDYFHRYAAIRDALKEHLPDLYSDLPMRDIPTPNGTAGLEGTGLIGREYFEQLLRDMDYMLEVRSHSRLGESAAKERPRRVFIGHGRSQDWREVQAYIEKDLDIDTLELAQEPNRGRTIPQKLEEESNRCSCAVIVMTGDDDVDNGPPRARENVVHEIGYFQGKYGPANVCLLHEEGTNIWSNIAGLVYISFPKGLVSASHGALAKELHTMFSEHS